MRDDYEPTPLATSLVGHLAVDRLVCPACGHECRPAELNPIYGHACPNCLRIAALTRMPQMVSVPIVIPADVIEVEPLVAMVQSSPRVWPAPVRADEPAPQPLMTGG
jgi:hypothetical protein